MKLLDRIVLNRLLNLILNFILSIVKIVSPKSIEDTNNPKPRRKIFPWRNKDE